MARTRSFDTDAVVAAAVQQFWTASYGATSTDDLCTTSHLSRSSLYNAFGSKRELYLQALRRYNTERSAMRAELLDRDLTGREGLRALFLAVLDDQWEDETRRACLGINACVEIGQADPEIARLLEANAADFDAAIAGLLRRGHDDGSVASTLPADDLARALHAGLDGLQVRSRVAPDRDAVRRDVDTLLALL